MATLASTSGARLVPDLGQVIADTLAPIGTRLRGDIDQADLESKVAAALGIGQAPPQDAGALGRLGQLSPQLAQAVGQADPQQAADLRTQAQTGMDLAIELQGLPDHASRLKRLATEAGTLAASGGDLNRLVELSNMDPSALDLELQRMQIIGEDTLSLLPQQATQAETFAALIADNPAIGTSLLGRRDAQVEAERARQAATAQAAARARAAAATPQTELGRNIAAIQNDIDKQFIKSEIGEQQIASLRAAAVAGVPFEGVTDLGKIIQDETAIINTFGEGSPQADAFAELRTSTAAGDPPSLSDIGGIRKEFTSSSGDYVTMRDAQAKIDAAAFDPSAAGDLALIFNYMKVLDPGSVVRESEFATAQNAAGIPERIRNSYNRVLSGERLGEGQREDFVDTSGRLFSAQEANQQLLIKEFTGIAERANINPNDVIIDFVGDQPVVEAGVIEEAIAPEGIAADTIVDMFPDAIFDLSQEELLAIPFGELSGRLSEEQWDALEALAGKFE